MSNYEKCDLCKFEEYTLVFSGPDLLTNLDGVFQIVRCNKCGLLRQNPRLDWSSLSKYYLEDYISHNTQIQEEKNPLKRAIIRYGVWKKVRLIKKYKNCGDLLDVGCGTGRFLEEAKKTGNWELTGIEPNVKAATYTAEKLEIEIMINRFEDFENYHQTFDVVTMWDVFEHLYFPLVSAKKIYRLLKPEGIFVFSIPNMNSWDRKLFKQNWIGYDLPRHLYFFDKKNLAEIISQSGFQIIESRIVAGSYDSIKNDVLFYYKRRKNVLSKMLLYLFNTRILRVLLLFPVFFLDKLKINPVITYVVKKI